MATLEIHMATPSNAPLTDAGASHSTCGECGHEVKTYWHDHTFRYGLKESAVDLTVRLPVRRCDQCDFDYLDEEGERLKHEAVCRHLGVLPPAEAPINDAQV